MESSLVQAAACSSCRRVFKSAPWRRFERQLELHLPSDWSMVSTDRPSRGGFAFSICCRIDDNVPLDMFAVNVRPLLDESDSTGVDIAVCSISYRLYDTTELFIKDYAERSELSDLERQCHRVGSVELYRLVAKDAAQVLRLLTLIDAEKDKLSRKWSWMPLPLDTQPESINSLDNNSLIPSKRAAELEASPCSHRSSGSTVDDGESAEAAGNSRRSPRRHASTRAMDVAEVRADVVSETDPPESASSDDAASEGAPLAAKSEAGSDDSLSTTASSDSAKSSTGCRLPAAATGQSRRSRSSDSTPPSKKRRRSADPTVRGRQRTWNVRWTPQITAFMKQEIEKQPDIHSQALEAKLKERFPKETEFLTAYAVFKKCYNNRELSKLVERLTGRKGLRTV